VFEEGFAFLKHKGTVRSVLRLSGMPPIIEKIR
jgi:hypothetical protein